MVLPLVPVMPTMRRSAEGEPKKRSAMRPTRPLESRDRRGEHRRGRGERLDARLGGLPQHGAGAARYRLGGEFEAVRAGAPRRKNRLPGRASRLSIVRSATCASLAGTAAMPSSSQ